MCPLCRRHRGPDYTFQQHAPPRPASRPGMPARWLARRGVARCGTLRSRLSTPPPSRLAQCEHIDPARCIRGMHRGSTGPHPQVGGHLLAVGLAACFSPAILAPCPPPHFPAFPAAFLHPRRTCCGSAAGGVCAVCSTPGEPYARPRQALGTPAPRPVSVCGPDAPRPDLKTSCC